MNSALRGKLVGNLDGISKGGNTSVQHAVSNANQAQSVLDGINPKYFNPDSRSGGGFYVGVDSDTIIAELAEHGNTAKYAISYDMNLSGQKVLDLTNPSVAVEWNYVQNSTSTNIMSFCIYPTFHMVRDWCYIRIFSIACSKIQGSMVEFNCNKKCISCDSDKFEDLLIKPESIERHQIKYYVTDIE